MGSPRSRAVVWFRNDLRVCDHTPLTRASETFASVVPLYCFDPRQFRRTPNGFPKTGSLRAKFLLESVLDLRRSLQSLGSDLVVRYEQPEKTIPKIVRKLGAEAVYYHREIASEELEVERRLGIALSDLRVPMRGFDDLALYRTEDLPFKRDKVPSVFSNFRRIVEKESKPIEPLPAPSRLPPLPTVYLG